MQSFTHQKFRKAIGDKVWKLTNLDIPMPLVKQQCPGIERRKTKICVARFSKGLLCELQHPAAGVLCLETPPLPPPRQYKVNPRNLSGEEG
jgi:hypothetical protein